MNQTMLRIVPLPDAWQNDLARQLDSGETMIAWFESDLDEHCHYAQSLLVLTDRRIVRLDARRSSKPAESWPLTAIASLRVRDRSGLGSLDLVGAEGRLFSCQFSFKSSRLAHAFQDNFDRFRRDGALAFDIPDVAGEPESLPSNSVQGFKLWSIFRLHRFARRHAGMILLGMFLTIAGTVTSLVPPYLAIPLTDTVLIPYQNQVENITRDRTLSPTARLQILHHVQAQNHERFARVPWILAGLAGAAIAAWLLGWAQGYVMSWVSERVTADLRNDTYAHLQKLSLEYFGGKRTGDLLARLSHDTERICTFLSDSMADFVADCLMMIGTGAVLFMVDPILALGTLCAFPPIAWTVYRAREHLGQGFHRGGKAWSEMTSVLADTLPGIRVVKAFAQEKREVQRFKQANDRILQANDRVNAVWTFFWPMVILLNQAGILVVWALGTWRVFEHQITVGVLIGFLTYITRFYTRLESMSRIVTATQRAATSATRILEILDREPSVPEAAQPIMLPKVRGAIEFKNVSFRYGNRRVLNDVSLSISPGEMIGLVGPSGAGKSTLVNLLCRFYDVTDGEILVDGVEVRRLAVQDYRRNIGLVLQEPFLFFGTIAENIAYGRPDASRGEILAAARAAKAHEFIMRLGDGYDTHVGERGQALSGGERQRISIARALLIDPAILILDEATSSVDTETEREIQEALDNLIRGRTTIAIAHRLSTLRKADRLVVLERGRIVEVGHHRDLLKNRGTYARLHKAQLDLSQGLAMA